MGPVEGSGPPSRTLDKAQIAALPLGWFPGRIRVADSPEAVAAALTALDGAGVLGLDTETRPAFKRGERYPVALLQLASADQAVLVQLHWAGLPPPLREVLESERIVKAAQAPADELRSLRRIYGVAPRGVVDVGRMVRDAGYKPSSVRGQAAHFLGIRISKSAQVSNWAGRRLSPAQQRYAATDAWVCRQSYLALRAAGGLHVTGGEAPPGGHPDGGGAPPGGRSTEGEAPR